MAEQQRPGITLTREQLEAWCAMSLTDEQVEQLEDAIPNSSIPEAVQTIVESFDDDDPLDVLIGYSALLPEEKNGNE